MPRGGFPERSQDGSGTSGGGSSGLVYSTGVDTLAALSALNDAALSNGSIIGVDDQFQGSAGWQLNKDSTATVDGVYAVATLSGVGRWIRTTYPPTFAIALNAGMVSQ